MRFASCVFDASGMAGDAAAPPSRAMKSRRLIWPSPHGSGPTPSAGQSILHRRRAVWGGGLARWRAAMPLSSPPTSDSPAGTELRLANGVTLLGKFDGEFAAQSQLRCRHECRRDGSAWVCERRNFMVPDSLSHAHAIA